MENNNILLQMQVIKDAIKVISSEIPNLVSKAKESASESELKEIEKAQSELNTLLKTI